MFIALRLMLFNILPQGLQNVITVIVKSYHLDLIHKML